MRVRAAVAVFLLVAFTVPVAEASRSSGLTRVSMPASVVSMPVSNSHIDTHRSLAAAVSRYEFEIGTLAATIEANKKPATKPRPARIGRAQTRIEPAAVYDSGSIEGVICSVFGENCAHALRIARCESGLNPAARNRSGASGLFEIMLPMHASMFEAHGWSVSDWADPYKNAVVAFDLSAGGTRWSAWVCR